MRAAFLALKGFSVTLCIPWVDDLDQDKVFPDDMRFDTADAHTKEIHKYLDSVGISSEELKELLTIRYYSARYSRLWRSLFCKGFIGKYIDSFDWLILEDPQQLLAFTPLRSLRKRALKVTGIIHTNFHFYQTQIMPLFLANILFRKDCYTIQRNAHDYLYLSS